MCTTQIDIKVVKTRANNWVGYGSACTQNTIHGIALTVSIDNGAHNRHTKWSFHFTIFHTFIMWFIYKIVCIFWSISQILPFSRNRIEWIFHFPIASFGVFLIFTYRIAVHSSWLQNATFNARSIWLENWNSIFSFEGLIFKRPKWIGDSNTSCQCETWAVKWIKKWYKWRAWKEMNSR